MTATAVPSPLTASSPRHTELHLGPIHHVRVRVRSAPVITLLSLVVSALGGPRQGVSADLARVVRATAPGDAVNEVCPVFDRHSAMFPSSLLPLGGGEQSVPERIEAMAELAPDRLWHELVEMFEGVPPVVWQVAMRHPRRWLRQFARLMSATWQVYAPIWRHTANLRSRESERVAAAAERGALELLLTGLSHRSRYAHGGLYLPASYPRRSELGDRILTLIPLTSGHSASAFDVDSAEQVWVGYPLPGMTSGRECDSIGRDRTAGFDPLTALLGPMRASILRVLRYPTTMGALARRLNTSPSTVTYHFGQLAEAGLVIRQRYGREVRAERTERGNAVVDALS